MIEDVAIGIIFDHGPDKRHVCADVVLRMPRGEFLRIVRACLILSIGPTSRILGIRRDEIILAYQGSQLALDILGAGHAHQDLELHCVGESYPLRGRARRIQQVGGDGLIRLGF